MLKSAAGALVGLSIVATAWVHSGATEAAHELLDSRWRGAYDILVTAADERAQIAGNAGDALPPYAIATARSRLTLSDLERIRAVPNVDVAAPVGDVLIRSRSDGPRVMYQVPLPSSRGNEVHALRVSIALTVGEEQERRSLRKAEYVLVLDLSDGASQVGLVGDQIVLADDCATSENAELGCHLVQRVPVTWAPVDHPTNVAQSSGYLSGDRLLFELPTLIETYPRVLFVDPLAERRLLGDAGDFLAPLSIVVPDFSVTDLQNANSDPAFPGQRDEVKAWLRSVPQSDASGRSDRERQVMPIVVASENDLDATLTVTVDAGFGAPTVAPDSETAGIIAWRFPADLLSGRASDRRDVSSFDASALIASADPKTAVIPLPGFEGRDHLAAAPPTLTRVREWAFTTPTRPHVSGDRLSLEIDTYLTPSAAESVDTPGDRWLAFESHARSGSADPVAHEVVETSSVAEGQGPLLVAVDEVSFAARTDATASTVPLATVDGTDTRIRAGDGATSQRVPPTFSGMGLSSTRPTAFANIVSAGLLGMQAPISSVRVRVAGVSDGYTADNLTKVQRVVDEMRSSGYHAVMVAGSSRAPVAIDVHGYPSKRDPNADGPTPPVIVEQEWSELGAVSRVDTVVSNGNELFALISVLCATFLFASLTYAELPARRHSAAVLAALGWTRASIHRTFWRQDLVPIAFIGTGAVIGAVSATLTNASSYAVPSNLGIALCVIAFVATPAAALLGIRLTTRVPPPLRNRHPRPAGRSWKPGIARRSLIGTFFAARDGRTVILTATPVLLAALATGGATVLANAVADGSGGSDIAALVIDRNQAAHALLACTGLIAAAGLLLATARMLSAQQRARARVLQQCGWTRTQRRRARTTEVASATVPATALATLAVWGLEVGSSPGGLVPVAVTAATGIVATMILAGSKEKQ